MRLGERVAPRPAQPLPRKLAWSASHPCSSPPDRFRRSRKTAIEAISTRRRVQRRASSPLSKNKGRVAPARSTRPTTRKTELCRPIRDAPGATGSPVQRPLTGLEELALARPSVPPRAECHELLANPLFSPHDAPGSRRSRATLNSQTISPVSRSLPHPDRAEHATEPRSLELTVRRPPRRVADHFLQARLDDVRSPTPADARSPVAASKPKFRSPPIGAAGAVDSVAQLGQSILLELLSRWPRLFSPQVFAKVTADPFLCPYRRVARAVPDETHAQFMRPMLRPARPCNRVTKPLETTALEIPIGRPFGPISQELAEFIPDPVVGPVRTRTSPASSRAGPGGRRRLHAENVAAHDAEHQSASAVAWLGWVRRPKSLRPSFLELARTRTRKVDVLDGLPHVGRGVQHRLRCHLREGAATTAPLQVQRGVRSPATVWAGRA